MRRRLATLALVLVVPALAVSQTTWWIDCNNPNCPGSGTPQDPFCKIQDAIDAALPGDTILVRPCTYVENLQINGKDITIRSDLDGDPATVDPAPTTTIIDGGTPTDPNESSVVWFRNYVTPACVLEGFTIQNGGGTNISGAFFGGGIFCHESSPTIKGNIIKDNVSGYIVSPSFGAGVACRENASPLITDNEITSNGTVGPTYDGGGVFCEDQSDAVIVGNDIDQNSSSRYGGGIYVSNSDTLIASNHLGSNRSAEGGGILAWYGKQYIENNTLASNTATNGLGGAIWLSAGSESEVNGNVVTGNSAVGGGGGLVIGASSSQVLVTSNAVVGNTSASAGGGIYLSGASVTIDATTVANNTARMSGGGIYCSSGQSTTITGSTFRDNIAGDEGGIYHGGALCWELGAGRSLILKGNSITRNTAPDNGGGVYCNGDVSSSVTISDTAFCQNRSLNNNGGGLYLSGCPASINNVTFYGNSASSIGGALLCSNSNALASNSIFWDDSALSGPEIALVVASTLSICYCDVEGGQGAVYLAGGSTLDWCPDNIDIDPLFVDPANCDLGLQSGSPCIDTGDAAYGLCCEEDLEGDQRLLDGDLDQDKVVDMGACEFNNAHLEITGSATPGGTLTITTTLTPPINQTFLFLSLAPGELCHLYYGCFYVSFAGPWWLFAWLPFSSSVDVDIPSWTPTPLPLYFQLLALSGAAGNLSNMVEVTIE
ncbi:MAG: right-handed parallel beta-helix repeat-containing protein [Planctomycetota bacterium]